MKQLPHPGFHRPELPILQPRFSLPPCAHVHAIQPPRGPWGAAGRPLCLYGRSEKTPQPLCLSSRGVGSLPPGSPPEGGRKGGCELGGVQRERSRETPQGPPLPQTSFKAAGRRHLSTVSSSGRQLLRTLQMPLAFPRESCLLCRSGALGTARPLSLSSPQGRTQVKLRSDLGYAGPGSPPYCVPQPLLLCLSGLHVCTESTFTTILCLPPGAPGEAGEGG